MNRPPMVRQVLLRVPLGQAVAFGTVDVQVRLDLAFTVDQPRDEFSVERDIDLAAGRFDLGVFFGVDVVFDGPLAGLRTECEK